MAAITAVAELQRQIAGRDCGKGLVDQLLVVFRRRVVMRCHHLPVRVDAFEGFHHHVSIHYKYAFYMYGGVENLERVFRGKGGVGRNISCQCRASTRR